MSLSNAELHAAIDEFLRLAQEELIKNNGLPVCLIFFDSEAEPLRVGVLSHGTIESSDLLGTLQNAIRCVEQSQAKEAKS